MKLKKLRMHSPFVSFDWLRMRGFRLLGLPVRRSFNEGESDFYFCPKEKIKIVRRMNKHAITLLLLATLSLSSNITTHAEYDPLTQMDQDLAATLASTFFIQLPTEIRESLLLLSNQHPSDMYSRAFLDLKAMIQDGYTIAPYDLVSQGITNALEILAHYNPESLAPLQKKFSAYAEKLEQTITHGGRAAQPNNVQYFPNNVVVNNILKAREIFADSITVTTIVSGTTWPLLSVPWTCWQYFVTVLSGTTASALWVPSNSINGTGYTGASSRNFGTITINVTSTGTYSFSFAYQAQNNTGIATFVINGVTTSVDTYNAFSTMESFTWTQVLTPGVYTIALSSLTKNVASSDYWLQFMGDGLAIKRVA